MLTKFLAVPAQLLARLCVRLTPTNSCLAGAAGRRHETVGAALIAVDEVIVTLRPRLA